MTFWNSSATSSVFVGINQNDGTGDPLRTAFTKIDNNFSNISSQLGSVNQDWINANVQSQFNVPGAANIVSLTTNILSGNILTAQNLIANTGLYSNTVSYLSGNTYVTGNIIPTVDRSFDLGSPSNYFNNFYVNKLVQAGTTETVDSGIFKIHAHANIGDIQDTGILGNVSSDYPNSFTYVFFGHQFTTNDFIYKTINYDATLSNNIIAGGIYGNVHFGSAFLSNTTASTSTSTGALIVAGGAGIGGDLNVGGNISSNGPMYSGGNLVITTGTPGLTTYSNISLFTNPIVFANTSISTSPYSGAVVLSYGGLGVGGSINAAGNITAYSPGALVGSLYGTIMTSAQPNINSVGTLQGLNVSGGISGSSLNLTGAGSGNTLVIGGAGGASINGSVYSAGNVYTGWLNLSSGINAVGTIRSSSVYGTSVYGTSVYDNNNRVLTGLSSSGSGSLTIGGSAPSPTISLTPAGPGVITVGSSTAIPVITTDAYGRIASLSTSSISTSFSLAGGSGTGSVAGGGTLTVSGGTAITTSVSGSTITINNSGVTSLTAGGNITLTASTGGVTISSTGGGVTGLFAGTGVSVSSATGPVTVSIGQSVATSAAPTFSGATFNGTVSTYGLVPQSNVTYNIGSSTAWYQNVYGTALHSLYADLAENYRGDANYDSGTVLVFGGINEVTVSDLRADTRVAGVVSTNPAHLMNGGLTGSSVVALALRGRVPVQVIGPVQKGDLLITSTTPGYAESAGQGKVDSMAVFAKSLISDLSNDKKIIEAVIL